MSQYLFVTLIVNIALTIFLSPAAATHVVVAEKMGALVKDDLTISGEIAINGDPGAPFSADIDGDGFVDIAVIVAKDNNKASVFIFWGQKTKAWDDSLEIEMGETDLSPLWARMRDSGSRTILAHDFNSDSKLDLGTSEGFAVSLGNRKFKWMQFEKTAKIPTSVGVIGDSKRPKLVVGVIQGLNQCSLGKGCESLVHFSNWENNLNGIPTDFVVDDFDLDGKADIVTGNRNEGYFSYILYGSEDYVNKNRLEDVHPREIQVGDVNSDGRPDLMAQHIEFITDFPSKTSVFLNLADGFKLHQTFTNFDNHNDNALLIHSSGEGACPSYLQIGVDVGFGVRHGIRSQSGKCNGFQSNQVQWIQLSTQTGVGIHCLRLSSDQECNLAVRDHIAKKIILFSYSFNGN